MTGQLPCPVCGYNNRPGAAVCEDCGLAIPQYQACGACGFMNTADSRFCGNCGTPVGIERKQSAGPAVPRTSPAPPPAPSLSAPLPGTAVGRADAPDPAKPGPVFKLVHEGTGVEIKLPFQDGALLIGRPGGDPDVDVSGFPEATVVSRRHAQLTVNAGRLAIEDLGSANGTYLNNARVRGPSPLADGDRIAFGQGAKVVFTVRLP